MHNKFKKKSTPVNPLRRSLGMSQSAGRQPILTGSLKKQNYSELHLKIHAVPRSKHNARALCKPAS